MSRTIIAAIISVIAGLGMMIGAPIDQETLNNLGLNLDTLIGTIMVIYGIVMAIFRKITSSPLVGWINK